MIITRRKLGRVVAGLGLCIGLAVATLGPVGYFAVAYSQLDHQQTLLAELKASRLAKYIYIHRELWQYNTLRLAELTEIPEARELNARQRTFDVTGNLVLETGEAPQFPVGHWSAPVVVAGKPLARVETAASLRPVLFGTLAVALLSSLLGLAIFFVIRILPVRMIDRTGAELDATQARYRLLFDVNPFPMAVIEIATERFFAVNDAAVEQYGWSREEFLAMTSDDLYLPEDLPALLAARQKPDESRSTRTVRDLRHRRKDGSVIDVEMSVRTFRFDGIPSMLVMGVDVTKRNRAEKDRLLAEEMLRQSQKMEAVGQLTGGIAHDFNNLLMVMLSNIEALEEDEDLAPTLKSRLEGISGAVDRAAELTRQLLAYSRKQSLRTQVTDINTLVAGTIKLLHRSLGSQIEISSVAAAGLWPVSVDRTQLETALVNLCVNARDAMPSGGKLLIEPSNQTLDADDVAQYRDVMPGDYVMVTITDNGTGMPPEILRKVFEPFFTTKGLGKGTGLGLSMVYGFIKQSNGHLEVDSTPGKGTTFRLYLPRTAALLPEVAAVKKTALPRGSERILVVEDEASVRANTVALLTSLGYDVAQAEDGAAGLAAFEGATRPYDLLLTDLMMPRLDGRALAAAVARRWPATKIVFMSGYADAAIVGPVDNSMLLLSKPFRKAELAGTIRLALEGVPAGSVGVALDHRDTQLERHPARSSLLCPAES